MLVLGVGAVWFAAPQSGVAQPADAGSVSPSAVSSPARAVSDASRIRTIRVSGNERIESSTILSYVSLSEVARLITGQRWNGPRFFGLRRENVR